MKPSIFKFLAAALLLPSAASAELLSQDSFSGYGLGELPFVTNPAVTGYTGDWLDVDWGNAEPAVTAGSLAYGGANYAMGSGNKVSVLSNAPGEITEATSGRVNRLFDSSLTVTDATAGTLYLSFLFQSGQETGATTYQTLALYQGGFTDPARNFDIGLTNNGGQTGTEYNLGTDNVYTTTGVAADTNVHLLVVRFDLSATAASDSVTVWVDPVLGAGEPAGGVTVTGKDLTWDRLTLSDYDGNSCAWDDIRWGTTFDSVTVESVLSAVPTFTLQPASYFGNVGDTVTLISQADSDPAPSYQWQYSVDDEIPDWTNIEGANNATLEIPSAEFADNGFYRVIADNGNPPAATSEMVEVFLTYPAPTIVTQPESAAVEVGSNVTLSVEATGLPTGTLSYQWYKDFEAIDGAISSTLVLNNVQFSDAGVYDVEVTDDAAEADGELATSTVSNQATVIVFEPWSGLESHEPFDTAAGYVEGELPGQDPAIIGYAEAWTDVDGGDAEPAVSAGSLIYPNGLYLGSSGDKVSVPTNPTGGETAAANSGRAYRLLDGPLVVNNATAGTRYLSFLFQSGQETGATIYQMLSLSGNTTGDGIRPFDIGLTSDGGQTGMEYNFGTAGSYTSTGVPADTNVHLMVVKFELSATAASDNVTVWVDPTLGSGDPAGGTLVSGVDLNWNRMFLSDYDANSAAWDEIRWGSTFDSVTLNPNPADNFAVWISNYPGVGDLTGFTDDADGDGIENGLENLFGTDPSVSNQGIVQVAKTGNTVTFQHPASATPASDILASYVWSTDLATFHADSASVGGATVAFETSTDAGTTTVTAMVTGTVLEKLFVALKATLTTP